MLLQGIDVVSALLGLAPSYKSGPRVHATFYGPCRKEQARWGMFFSAEAREGLLMSYPLISHWPKQVTWLNPSSKR